MERRNVSGDQQGRLFKRRLARPGELRHAAFRQFYSYISSERKSSIKYCALYNNSLNKDDYARCSMYSNEYILYIISTIYVGILIVRCLEITPKRDNEYH